MSLLRVSSSAAGDRAALLDVANCHETRVDVSTVAVTRPGCDRRPSRSHGEVTLQVSPRDETLEVTFVSCRRVAHLVRLSEPIFSFASVGTVATTNIQKYIMQRRNVTNTKKQPC